MPNALIYLFRSPAASQQPTSSRRLGAAGLRVAAGATLAVALAGCSTVSNYVPGFIKPYKADIQQGNWLTQQQVATLRQGMTREQVRFALGSPTLTNIFRADRWDYPYRFTPGNGTPEDRVFTVFFVNDRLDRWAGDPQPDRQPFQKEAPATRREAATPAMAPGQMPLSTNPAQPPNTLPAQPTLEGTPPPAALDPSAPPVAAP